MMPHKLKLLALVFSIISYSSSVYSVDTTLEQSTGNSFAPGGSTNDVSLAQSDLFQVLALFENDMPSAPVTSLGDLFNILLSIQFAARHGMKIEGISKFRPFNK